MSTVPEPSSLSPSRASGLWCSWPITVSTCPSSRIRRAPVPVRRSSRSGAWPGEEHGRRSATASPGASAAQIAAHSSAPRTSPEGEETPTSASSSRSARAAISRAPSATQSSILRCTVCPSCRRWRSSRAAWTRRCPARWSSPRSRPASTRSRRSTRRCTRSRAARSPACKRRGKLLVLELGELVVLVHLMSAGPHAAPPQARLAARQGGAADDPPARATTSCACASSAPSRRCG